MLEIKHQPSGEMLQIDALWLRDHCRCGECYNVATRQRKHNLLELPARVQPLDADYAKDGLLYKVKWNDGHESLYDIDFLYESQLAQLLKRRQRAASNQTPWNRAIVLQNERHMRVNLPQLVESEQQVYAIVSALVRYGIAFIDEVPPNATMTELAIRRIFPIMRTFFGDVYTFTDAPDHADSAYSKEYLGSHNDNTYFCDAAGLQALHCIAHRNGSGGESFFVDGLHAVLELKRRNPRAFEILSSVQVPGEYIEQGEHHKYSAPIIRLDPLTQEVVQLRLNVHDRAVLDTLPQTQMQEFYASLRELLQIVQSTEQQWLFKLHPGTIVIFDNWRVLHGRCSYTGQRTMTGAYVQRTDFMSKARVLEIID